MNLNSTATFRELRLNWNYHRELKLQIPNCKHQRSSQFQNSKGGTMHPRLALGSGVWKFFGIESFEFAAFVQRVDAHPKTRCYVKTE